MTEPNITGDIKSHVLLAQPHGANAGQMGITGTASRSRTSLATRYRWTRTKTFAFVKCK